MVNQQIVEYVTSQLKSGVSLDAIKAALVSAGWATADVEDSVKGMDASASPNASATNHTSAGIISVNDLIPNSGLSPVSKGAATERKEEKIETKKEEKQKEAKALAASIPKEKPVVLEVGPSERVPAAPRKISIWMIVAIVCGLLAIGGGAASVYFYSQAKGLQDKITSLTGSGASASSKVADLTAQLNDVVKVKDDLSAQIISLTSQNQDLTADLSYFVAPFAAGSSTPQVLSVEAKGTLSAGALYTVTLSNGIKLFVANSKDAKVAAALKPLVGTSVSIVGGHNQGSNMVTVTSVNGNSVQ